MTLGKRIVLFDLDGTLANVTHRAHLIDGSFEGYHRFHCACVDDTLYGDVATVAKTLNEHYAFWIVTSRPVEMEAITRHWLQSYLVVPDRILMRPIGDTRHGYELKRSWIHAGLIPKDSVLCVFDDKPEDVAMWRDEGFLCFHVRRPTDAP